ncbi:MAG: hypothetical protein ACLRQZ_07775 [Clostridia bacterium]
MLFSIEKDDVSKYILIISKGKGRHRRKYRGSTGGSTGGGDDSKS